MLNRDRIINANMEELLDKAIEDNVSLKTFQVWCIFKLAQYIEKIAYSRRDEDPKK